MWAVTSPFSVLSNLLGETRFLRNYLGHHPYELISRILLTLCSSCPRHWFDRDDNCNLQALQHNPSSDSSNAAAISTCLACLTKNGQKGDHSYIAELWLAENDRVAELWLAEFSAFG